MSNIEQRSPEWFEARKGRITGSVVGAILGLNPYKNAADVMRDMLADAAGKQREFQGNDATAWGTMNESGAIFDYEMETGNKVEKCGFYTFEEWLGASPDGLVGDDGLIEVKCPYRLKNDESPAFKTAAEQPYYLAQIQIQLLVTGRQWCDFWQWSPNGISLEKVPKDAKWLARAMPVLREFYEKYLARLSGDDDLVDQFALVSEYDFIKGEIERFEQRKKAIIDELVASTKGLGGEVAGRKLTRVEKKGPIAYAKVVKEHLPGFDVEPYRGESSSYWLLK